MYQMTIENGGSERMLYIAGTVTDEEWRKRQVTTEGRYSKRKVKYAMTRVKGSWVAREA